MSQSPPFDSLPPEIHTPVDIYRGAVKSKLPDLVEGLYLIGSLGFGEYRHGTSDIDMVVTLRKSPSDDAISVFRKAFEDVRNHSPSPFLDGVHIVKADLRRPPEACPLMPCSHEWSFEPAGRGGDHVTWHELAKYSVVVDGPALTGSDVLVDQQALREFTQSNLRDYWKANLDRIPDAETISRAGRGDWFVQWFVLGTARLHHLLTQNELTSKSGAGRYAREHFEARWHPIVEEALRLRDGSAPDSAHYHGNDIGAINDAIRFSRFVCEDGLAQPV